VGRHVRAPLRWAVGAVVVWFLGSCTGTSANGSPRIAASSGQVPSTAVGGRWWRPGPGWIAWQWELDHPLSPTSDRDMGVGGRTPSGNTDVPPNVYDIDGFDNPASTVAALHRFHDHVICYIEVGAAESFRPDYAAMKATGLGRVVAGYPDERYLDINRPSVVTLIEKRIQMCAQREFDAVEPDIDDSYSDATGFAISEAANLTYDATLARYAHSLGLGFALKNGDANGFARLMLPRVDFVVDEQCIQYDTCGAFEPAYRNAHLAVLEAEYVDGGGPSPARYCPAADPAGLSSVQYRTALDGSWRVSCR
jgi:Glycoside-hydrolase family GH114